MTGEAQDEDEAPLLAGVVFDPGFAVDALFEDVAAALRASGLAPVGVAQVSDGAGAAGRVRLRSLGAGWEIGILQDRGQHAEGCRLDPRAIAEVAARLAPELTADTPLLVVNRFGRAESEGHGLRQIIAQAALMPVPALVGVRREYAAAWAEFHGGMGVTLPADRDAILAWARAACRMDAQAEVAAS